MSDRNIRMHIPCYCFVAALLALAGCGGPLPPPDPHNLASAKDSLGRGNHWFSLGCYAEAENYFREGLNFARMSDEVNLIIRAQNSAGAAALARGDFDLAATQFQAALNSSQSQLGEPDLDKILANLGSLAFRLGRYDDATAFWQRALETARVRGLNPAFHLCDLARLKLAQGHESDFLALAAEALAASETNPDPMVRADALNLAGKAAMAENRLEEAESFFLQALELDRKTENTTGLAQDTESLGLLMMRLKRHQEAAGFFDRSFFLWLAINDDQRAGQILAHLQNLSREKNIPKTTTIYQEALLNPAPYRLTNQCP